MHRSHQPAPPTPRQHTAARVRHAALPALLLAALLSGCSHGHTLQGTVTPAMSHDSAPHPQAAADSRRPLAVLVAQFRYYTENRLLDFRYTLTNDGAAPLAVFDRGSLDTSLDAVGPTGKVARPTIRIENGDVTLDFPAQPTGTPDARLLALELTPKGRVQVEAWETLPGTDAVKRVRLCIPVAPMSDGQFEGAINGKDGPVRIATAIPRTQLLCSDWVDIEHGAADWTG